VQTGAVESLERHPLRLYHDLGVRVTVNTDNRLITDTTVSKELWLAHTKMGLDAKGIARLILNGFKSAFLPFHIKQTYLRRIAAEIEGFVENPLLHAETVTKSQQPRA
jgi:adenosine deaminase